MMKTISINMNKPGRSTAGQNINPNVSITKEIVFEVPPQKYEVQVIMPTSAKVGFNGSVVTSGPYFLYDIGSQLVN